MPGSNYIPKFIRLFFRFSELRVKLTFFKMKLKIIILPCFCFSNDDFVSLFAKKNKKTTAKRLSVDEHIFN